MRRREAGIALSTAALGALTGTLAPLVGDEQLLNVALLYLLLTLLTAGSWGYIAGLATAVLANLLLNFFFVPPLHTFTVQRPENVAALLVFLTVATIGASMFALLRQQVAQALASRTETAVLRDGRACAPCRGVRNLSAPRRYVADGRGLLERGGRHRPVADGADGGSRRPEHWRDDPP